MSCAAASNRRASNLPLRAATLRLATASARTSRSLNRSSTTTGRPHLAADCASARPDAETTSSGDCSDDAGMVACFRECIPQVQVERLVRLEHGFEQAALGLVLDVADLQCTDAYCLSRARPQRLAVIH